MHRLALSPALPGPLARGHLPRLRAGRQAHPAEGLSHDQGGVLDKLKELAGEIDAGVRKAPAGYTVRQAAADWLADGLPGRSAETVRTYDDVLAPLLAELRARKVRELSADDVARALAVMARTYSTSSVARGHLALKRTLRYAQARSRAVKQRGRPGGHARRADG